MDRAQVFVRVRGLNSSEKGESKVIKCSTDKITVNDKTYPLPSFGNDVTVDRLYSEFLQSSVSQGVSRGINVGILCLGESKSGKSSSLGLSSKVGLVALTADTVFQHVEKFNHFVEVSYLNIYHEKFTDLLNPADKDIKVKTHAHLGQYMEDVSELHVTSAADLMRLFDQGNKVRKILELEMSIPSTKSHAIFTITCEHKTKEAKLVRTQIQFHNLAGLNHSKEYDVTNSLKNLESLVAESVSSQNLTGHVGSKLTQLLKPLMDRSSFLSIVGHVSPTAKSLGTTTQTLDLLMKFRDIEIKPKSRTLDTPQLITDLRKRVAVARNAIMTQNSGNIPKEHIAELDSSVAALSAVKRLQWSERERASALAEEQRRQTLADKGVLEWITESSGQVSNTSSSVLLLQKDKDRLTSEYKSQRKTVDQLKTELQSRITSHTSLAEQSNQSEAVLQDSLAEIHKLRDQLKSANEKLKELKKSAKDTQDKLRIERSHGAQHEAEVSGNFVLTMMMKKDEVLHLKKDNKIFLDEEKERVQSEADQEIAEMRLSATQGNTLTLEQLIQIQEQHAQQTAQMAHLALRVQCLQAENEKLTETVEALNSAHTKERDLLEIVVTCLVLTNKREVARVRKRLKVEAETQKARNLLTFRQYKDFYEESKAATNAKYQELVNSCVQDCVFLSSKSAELTEENTELKRKLKHYC